MEVLRKEPTVKAGTDGFVGDAWIDAIVRSEEPSRDRVSIVLFAPGARNAWHEAAERGTESEWGDQVTDVEYLAEPAEWRR